MYRSGCVGEGGGVLGDTKPRVYDIGVDKTEIEMLAVSVFNFQSL